MRLIANGIPIEVDDQGPPGGTPVLLLMGLGMQLVAWPEPFVAMLVRQGLRVIRIDNRDAGLSADFAAHGLPNLAWLGLRHSLRLPVRSPYTLQDMADDAVGVLDALGLPAAHLVGASMGGMIAQVAALRVPQRVRGLTLVMSTPGARGLPGPSGRVRAAMLARPPAVRRLPADAAGAHRPDPRDLPALVAHLAGLLTLLGSAETARDAEGLRQRIGAAAGRAWRPEGTARQLAAIMAGGDRTPALSGLRLPVTVVHGLADPLLPPAHGRALASAIPGARLQEIEGMGHDLPPSVWQPLADRVAEQALAAGPASPTGLKR
jgi:pimeloyl-ACP methyl ester carboxylesterase